MQYLCISRRLPGCDVERLKAIGRAETRAAWRQLREGAFDALNFDATSGRGIVTLHAASEAEARARLSALPMVQERLIDFDVHAMGPYLGLEALFAAP